MRAVTTDISPRTRVLRASYCFSKCTFKINMANFSIRLVLSSEVRLIHCRDHSSSLDWRKYQKFLWLSNSMQWLRNVPQAARQAKQLVWNVSMTRHDMIDFFSVIWGSTMSSCPLSIYFLCLCDFILLRYFCPLHLNNVSFKNLCWYASIYKTCFHLFSVN